MSNSNVSTRDGSKATSRATGHDRGGMKVAPQHDGGKPSFSDGAKASADTGETRDVDYNKGGKNKDVGQQNADVAKPGQAGHRSDQNSAGKLFNAGGEGFKMSGFAGAEPAQPGHTSKPSVPNAKTPPGGTDADTGREFQGPRSAHGHTVVPANPVASIGSPKTYPKADDPLGLRGRETRDPLGLRKR